MGAYTALLDREKLLLIARLKETFDRIDTDRSGFLGMSEIRLCFQKIGLEAGHAKVILSFISFYAFVSCFGPLLLFLFPLLSYFCDAHITY